MEKDPRFVTRDVREDHSQELIAILDRVFAQKTRAEWLQILKDYDIVAAPVNTPAEVVADPQALANNYIVGYDHPVLGRVKLVGFPAHLERTPAWIERPAPALGEHTEEVLREVAGYSPAEVQRLRDSEAI